MENAISKKKSNQLKEKAKRDSVVLESMANTVVSSESILKSLSIIQNSGSTLYRHNFKRLTKQFRRECVSVLNNYYDLMDTGGVSDSFIMNMKQKAVLHSKLAELDGEQIRRVGMFIGSMLEESIEKEPESLEVVEREKETEVTIDEKIEEVEENIEDLDQQIEDTIDEINHAEEEGLDGYDKELDGVDLSTIKNPLDEMVKIGGSESYELKKQVEVVIDNVYFQSVQEEIAMEGGLEADILRDTVNSIATRRGVDTTNYVYSSAKPTKDDRLSLIFRLIE